MSNALSSRRLSIATSMIVSLMGLIGSSAHAVSRPFEGMAYSPRDRSTPTSRARSVTYKSKRTGQRKLLRTTRAMTHQGRDLKAHFDAHRLTRSQLKKFYAGKGITAY